MSAKLIVSVTQLEGEFERKNTLLRICKKAIEGWGGDNITVNGYNVSIYGNVNDIKGQYLFLETKEKGVS